MERKPEGPTITLNRKDGTTQEYIYGLFRVASVDEFGRPEECVYIPEDRQVEVAEGDRFMTAFVPWTTVQKQTHKRTCCLVGCGKQATVHIQGPEGPEDYTETCDEHVEQFRIPGSSVTRIDQ